MSRTEWVPNGKPETSGMRTLITMAQFDIRTEKLMAQEQARAEGKAEGKAEMAKRMKADGVPVESIAKYSSLTEAEIKAL